MGIWPRPKPRPPATTARTIVIRTSVPGAEVSITDNSGWKMADEQGDAFFEVSSDVMSFNLHIRAPHYPQYGEAGVKLPPGPHHFNVGPTIPITQPGFEIEVPAWKSSRLFPPEVGLLRIDGVHFHTDDGALWQWRNATAFLLFLHFLDGKNIQPIIDEWVGLGANMVRVLGMVDWAHRPEVAGRFWPQKWPDYYAQLSAFVDLLAKNGLRVELVVFADAQIVMPDETEQNAHFDTVIATLKDKWNVIIEVCNEPFKNIPGHGKRSHALGKRWKGKTPLLIASGAGSLDIKEGDFPTLKAMTLDHCTTHTLRGGEWMRKQKDALEIQRKLDVPVLSDEPTGADENMIGSSRSNNPVEFGEAAAILALQVAGGAFHSTDGNGTTLLRPITKQCAVAWFEAFRWVGTEAQAGQYVGGHLRESPIEHSDALCLRTFSSIMGDVAKIVVIRPTTAWKPIVKNGWKIVEQNGPRGARLLMKR